MTDKEEALKARISRGAAAEALLNSEIHQAAWSTVRKNLQKNYESQKFDVEGAAAAEEFRRLLFALNTVQSLYERAVRDGEQAQTQLQKLKQRLFKVA